MHLGFPFSVFPILLCLLSRVTITCRDFCELWYLHKPLLDVIFLQFPKIKRNIHRLVYDAGLELGSILPADKLKYTVPFKKSLVASSNFRSLSMVYSEDGTLLRRDAERDAAGHCARAGASVVPRARDAPTVRYAGRARA